MPRVLNADEVEITPFTVLVQGVGYLIMMGVANLLYSLGPLSERLVRPANADRYRQLCYRLGFWFSVLLPSSIPLLLTISVLFFPGSRKQ